MRFANLSFAGNRESMDRRFYALPVASLIVVAILVARPGITGFVSASSPLSEISAKASVAIASDGFIPEDAIVTVHLDDKSGSMRFGEFAARTGAGHVRIREQIPTIDYDGYGYGEGTYAVDISEFGIDATAEPGEHSVSIEVTYGNHVLSSSTENMEV